MNNNFISMPSVLQQEVKMKLESLMLFGYHFSYNAMAMCTYVLLLLPCICVCLFRDYLLPPLGVCILFSATNFYQIYLPPFLAYHFFSLITKPLPGNAVFLCSHLCVAKLWAAFAATVWYIAIKYFRVGAKFFFQIVRNY